MSENVPMSEAYKVVINHEEQYSIWWADRPEPAGWRAAGKVGTKQECLAFIDQVWTDMRPLSLREQLAGSGAGDTQTAADKRTHQPR